MNYYKCDRLSNFKDYEINNLYDKALNTKLNYRSIFSMDKNITFGTEIEFVIPHKNGFIVKDYFKNNYQDWKIDYEYGCFGGEDYMAPLEIDSPILKNNKVMLKKLKDIFNYLYNNNASINLYSGNHIHYDISILKNKYKYYERFLKFFTVYEPIIYMFSCGELRHLRNKINTYAKEIGLDYQITFKYDNKKSINYLKQKYSSKDNAIRFSKFNTIEIRTPMGTLNPYINQNYILFFYKIFEYVTSNNYNEELINKKFNTLNRKSVLIEYNNICNSDVLELSDMLYDNNLDKIYFLKQCLKLYNNNDVKHFSTNNYNLVKRRII